MIQLFAFISLILGVTLQAEQFYGQYHQDKLVYEKFFKDKRNGVFVDVGAHDGITYSNTYFFEKDLGWTGICIEPIPEVYEQLKRNRNCLCIQGCIFQDREEVPFLRVSGYAEMLSGILANYNSEHIKRIKREIAQHGGRSEVIKIRCYSLTKLLLDHEINHVDYLSIDTEGGELAILRSIDFTRINIDIIEVENNYNDPIQAYLESFGYKKIMTMGPDEIYQKIGMQ
jgi:FkbM family methyltransferase